MDFKSAVSFLRSFLSYEDQKIVKYGEANFDLEKMRRFLEEFGVDYKALKCVHVAGSKGKGSVSTMIASYLSASGRKTGLFTSPYIFNIRESFWLDGKLISERSFVSYVEKLRKFLKKYKGEKMTYFELLTALVFQYFSDKKVDYAVIEVGIGGRLDATNVINPVICALTTVEMEHANILGDSLEEILNEKLGIVKAGVPLVIGAQNEDVRKYVKKKLDKKCELLFVNAKNVFLDSLSLIQRENAATMWTVVRRLIGKVDEKIFRKVLKNFEIPGRMDVKKIAGLSVVFDMAHTVSSTKNLINSLKKIYGKRKYVFLFSLMRDKRAEEILKLILPHAEKMILTFAHPVRAFKPEELLTIAEKISPKTKISIIKNPKTAYKKILKELKKDQVLVVTGSHFLLRSCGGKI